MRAPLSLMWRQSVMGCLLVGGILCPSMCLGEIVGENLRTQHGGEVSVRGSFVVTASVGFDSSRNVLGGAWTPLTLTLTSQSESTQEVFVSIRLRGIRRQIQIRPERLVLPTLSRLSVQGAVFIPEVTGANSLVTESVLSVRVSSAEGTKRIELPMMVHRRSRSRPVLIVVVESAPSQPVRMIHGSGPYGRSGHLPVSFFAYAAKCSVPPRDLPTERFVLSDVDMIVLHGSKEMASLSRAQWELLRQYVVGGGHLVVEGDIGLKSSKLAASEVSSLLGINCSTLRLIPPPRNPLREADYDDDNSVGALRKWNVTFGVERSTEPSSRAKNLVTAGAYKGRYHWFTHGCLGKGLVSYVGGCLEVHKPCDAATS